MDLMNFDKALSILGLTKKYTDEELKKTYRRLMVKYHPDKWEGKTEAEKKMAEEKAKEINAAKDFLENYKGQRTHTYTNTNNNNYYSQAAHNYAAFVQAKTNFIKELKDYDRDLMGLIDINDITKLRKRMLLTLNDKYILIVLNSKNIYDLNNAMTTRKKEIFEILERYTTVYCQKYHINTDISKLEKYSLKKLYKQLETLRREQNSIEIKLNQKQEEYILWAGYNVIKENITKVKEFIIIEFQKGCYKTEQNAINYFEEKILKEFKEYYRRLEVINNLKKLGYTNKVILDNIALMEKNITADKFVFKKYEQKVTNAIAEIETQRTPKTSTKSYKIKENRIFNNKYNTIKKDYFIKHNEVEEPKYKIKKNR